MRKVLRSIMNYGAMGAALLANMEVRGTESYPKAYHGYVDYGNTPPSAEEIRKVIPDSPVYSGGKLLPQTKHLAVLASGRCLFQTGTIDPLTLTEATDTTWCIYALNESQKIIFTNPRPIGEVTISGDVNGWVQISIESARTVSGHEDVMDYLCLGIRKYGGDSFIDRIHCTTASDSNAHTEAWVNMAENGTLELVPLMSKTKLSEGYTPVMIGGRLIHHPLGKDYAGSDVEVNLSVQFSIKATLNSNIWRNESITSLSSETEWPNRGQLGMGAVEKKGMLYRNMLVVGRDGRLAYSDNGTNWTNLSRSLGNGNWDIAPVYCENSETYGQDLWCVIGSEKTVYLGSGMEIIKENPDMKNAAALTLYDDHFIAAGREKDSDGFPIFQLNSDMKWVRIGHISCSNDIGFLCAGEDKLICGTVNGEIYRYGAGEWTLISSDSEITDGNNTWSGCCYANGAFYAVRSGDHIVATSKDGAEWYKIANLEASQSCYNITFRDTSLYVLSSNGQEYYAGRFEADGTMAKNITE